MRSTFESWRRLSGSGITHTEGASRCYWEKIPREIPARSLVSSDTFDSVRWFRKYDTTSHPRPFGARPSLKSPASGGHTYFTAVYAAAATWYTNETKESERRGREKSEKKSERNHRSNVRAIRGRKSADYRSSRDTLSEESRARGDRGGEGRGTFSRLE